MINFILNVLVGYVLCILLPCPWLSAKVLSLWQNFGVKAVEDVENLVDNGNTTDPVTPAPTPVTPNDSAT